jgi:uncharacterized protein YacL
MERHKMSLEFIIRIIGMILIGAGGIYLGVFHFSRIDGDSWMWGIVTGLVGALAGLILTPYLTTRPIRKIRSVAAQVSTRTMFTALLGLVVGLIVAALVSFPLSLMPPPFGHWLPFIGAVLFSYIGSMVFVMRENDIHNLFRTRLSTSRSENSDVSDSLALGRSVLLDTSVIIDGRIADIARTGFIDGKMLVPSFVLNELQHIADSSDSLRRQRGRRGLDILNRLQKDPSIPLRITDIDVEGVREVDDKLVILGKQLHAPILTNDYNLNRVAELQGVQVLNINELANAVKAVYLPGEQLEVEVIQEGKETGQGVGYLDDGTMVVIEDGRTAIGNTILVLVTKVLQTAAGRMIFARISDGD